MGLRDHLYEQLAAAQTAGDQLAEKQREDLQKLEAAETQLQQQRAESEQAGDKARLEQIDSDLDQLTEAWRTTKAQLDAHEQPDAPRQGDERDRDPDGPEGREGSSPAPPAAGSDGERR